MLPLDFFFLWLRSFETFADRSFNSANCTMADDDIWASGEDNDQVAYDQMIAQREWEKMNEVHGNVSKPSLFSFTFGCLTKVPLSKRRTPLTDCSFSTFAGGIQRWYCCRQGRHYTRRVQQGLQRRCCTGPPVWQASRCYKVGIFFKCCGHIY